MTVIVVTGIQAAGKSAVAQAVAERLDRSVHLRGDVFRRMIVNGRAEMGPAGPPVQAERQLRLRYKLAATVAEIRSGPLYVVVLAPRAEVVQAREDERRRERGKVAYKPGDDSVAELDAYFRRETPRIGLWLDTSEQTVAETADGLLARVWAEAEVPAI